MGKKEQLSLTVAEAWHRYALQHLKGLKAEGEYHRLYTVLGRIYPGFSRYKVADVRHEHLIELMRRMKGTPVQANRVLACLTTFFRYCELINCRPFGSNPCTHIKRYPERPRRRQMTAEEAVKIGALLEKYERSHPQSVLFIWLLLLTGARKSEIAKATLSQVRDGRLHDLDNKTGDPRPIYLPPVVLDLIKRAAGAGGPNDTLTGISTPKRLWERIRREAGCPDLRLHDLRRTYASAALSLGYSLDQVGALLRHRSAQTTMRYAYLKDDVEQTAAKETAEAILNSLTPGVSRRRLQPPS